MINSVQQSGGLQYLPLTYDITQYTSAFLAFRFDRHFRYFINLIVKQTRIDC